MLLANSPVAKAGEIHAGLGALAEAVKTGDEIQTLHCLMMLVPEFQPNALPEDRRQRRNRPDLRVVK